MPYAEEFRAAAAVFDVEADAVVAASAALSALMGPDVLQGGRLTADVEALIDDAAADAAADADTLTELAAECRRRAELCDLAAAEHRAWLADMSAHERAMSTWRASVHEAANDSASPLIAAAPPTAPPRPIPGHDWIEF